MKRDLSIRLFGRVCAEVDGKVVDTFTTNYCRSLLAFLAMHADVDHPRERIIQALWPGASDHSARNRLSVTLYHLRQSLAAAHRSFPDVIVAGRSWLRLDPAGVAIDLHAFRADVLSARLAKDAEKKRARYRSAVDYYRGPLAPGIKFDWALARQIEASELFQEAVLWLATDLEKTDGRDSAMALIASALDTEPYSESATELLTSWYVEDGEYEKAFGTAKRLRRALAAQGRAPGRQMMERIDQLNAIMTDKTKAVVFADEATLTIMGAREVEDETFSEVVRESGAKAYNNGPVAFYFNPLQAYEAGKLLLASSPRTVLLLHTSVMSPNDPPPQAFHTALDTLEQGGLYGTEATAVLLRQQGIASRAVPATNGKVYKLC
ncbi:MAG TPA: BTAD domain-containing putative transcriptional regulator [Fimbriimonadaceae bacterium]|nr:BTAD domain-containing putative transcriptional regulator [Fimbriimonadaceae bacterium]